MNRKKRNSPPITPTAPALESVPEDVLTGEVPTRVARRWRPTPRGLRFLVLAMFLVLPNLLYAYYGICIFLFVFIVMVRALSSVTRWAWVFPMVVYGLLAWPASLYDKDPWARYACSALLLLLRPAYSANEPLNSFLPHGVATWILKPPIRWFLKPLTDWIGLNIQRTMLVGGVYSIVVALLCLWALRAGEKETAGETQ